MSPIKPIDEHQARSLDVLYVLMASFAAVGAMTVVIFMFTRSLTCCG